MRSVLVILTAALFGAPSALAAESFAVPKDRA